MVAGGAAVATSAMAPLINLGCYESGNSVMLPPAFGTWAQNNRGIFRGPSFEIWDMSVTKSMKIKERVTAAFRHYQLTFGRAGWEADNPGGRPWCEPRASFSYGARRDGNGGGDSTENQPRVWEIYRVATNRRRAEVPRGKRGKCKTLSPKDRSCARNQDDDSRE